MASDSGNKQSDIKVNVELAVNVNKQVDMARIKDVCQSKGFKVITSDLEAKTLQIELNPSSIGEAENLQSLQRSLERQTGILTIVKGVGSLSSAISEIGSPSDENKADRLMGVVRMSQMTDGSCLVDGFIDGLRHFKGEALSQFQVAVHEFGDLSGSSYESIGEKIVDIHHQRVSDSNHISISKVIPNCDVANLIGRSLAVSRLYNPGSQGTVIGAAVVARASTIHSNKKQICSCSGKTLWEERLDKVQSYEHD